MNALDQNDMTAAARAEAGRSLGYEMAVRGMQLGSGMPREVAEGYAEGKYSSRRAKAAPSAFVRKLMRLKVSAWKRGRYVDEAVTAEFLESIAVTHCPVTRVEMTSGTGTGTDMSVDRVFNGGAYAVGNIAFMSANANHAKGSLMPLEIVDVAKRAEEYDGLKPEQWLRLACMTCQATPPGYPVSNLPMLVYPPNGLLISNGYVAIQQSLSLLAGGFIAGKWQGEFAGQARGKKSKRTLKELLEVLARTTRSALIGAKTDQQRQFALCDAWLPPLVFDRYMAMVRELDIAETNGLVVVAKRAMGSYKEMRADELEAWGIERNGYVECRR